MFPPRCFNKDFISKSCCTSLKGFFALVVILHHIALKYPSGGLVFDSFSYLGFIAVSVFFFISGYGLIKNYSGKDTRVDFRFVKKYFVKIGIPFIVFNLLYFCVSKYGPHPYSLGYVVLSYITYGRPIVDSGWFMVVYISLLIVFFCTSRISGYKTYWQLISALVVCVGWAMFCKWKSWGAWWYYSNLSYVIGMFFGYNESQIVAFFKTHYRLLLPFFFLAFIVSFNLAARNSDDIVAHLFSGAVFPVLVFTICGKVRIGNAILEWLGRMSLELYLVHGLFLNHFAYFTNSLSNSITVIGLSICSAFLLHFLFSTVNRFLLSRKKV